MPAWTKSRTIRGLYKYYRYRKSKDHECYVDEKKYRAIISDFFELLQQYIIDGNIYHAPFGMGEFRIYKYRSRNRPRDYNAEKEYFKKYGVWKRIGMINWHSDGYKIRIGWMTKGYSTMPLNGYYRFETNRKFRHKLVKKLKTEGNSRDYYKVSRKTRLKDTKTLI